MQPMELFPDGQFGRTSQEPCRPTMDEILEQSSTKWLKQGRVSKSTLCWTLSTSEFRSGAVVCSLSDILTGDVPQRNYLSARACLGILRRAEKRGKKLLGQLRQALRAAAGIETTPTPPIAS